MIPLPYLILGAVAALAVFVLRYFLQNFPRDWSKKGDGEFADQFLALVATEDRWEKSQRDVLAQIVKKWTHDENCNGVILGEKSTTKGQPPTRYQMIAFQGPAKMRQLPMVEIHWGYVSTLKQARDFLKDEKAEAIELDPEVFRSIFEHVASHCSSDEELAIDPKARCKIYEGYLSPRY